MLITLLFTALVSMLMLLCWLVFLALKLIELSKENLTRWDPLHGRLSDTDKRYPTFRRALDLLEERNAKILVETGTSRSGDRNFKNDGGSSVIFSHWAKQRRCHFYSVDKTKKNLNKAKKAITSFLDATTLVHDDSVHFLEQFPGKIDFLYLDSLDFDENNPELSQNHHLKEIKAAYEKLSPRGFVMIDDCKLPHGGKGKKAIEFLTEKGWKIAEDGYQVILLPSSKDN